MTEAYDAVLMPTLPLTAPRIADLEADPELHGSTNLRMICIPIANPTDPLRDLA